MISCPNCGARMVRYTPFDSIHPTGNPECIKGCKTEYSDSTVTLDAASMQASSAVYYPSGPKFKYTTPTGSNTIGAMVPTQTWTRHAWGFTSDRTLSSDQMDEIEKTVASYISKLTYASFSVATTAMSDGSILAQVTDVNNKLRPFHVPLQPTTQQSKYTYTYCPTLPNPHQYERRSTELYCNIRLPEHALDEIMGWIWALLPVYEPTWQGYTKFHVFADSTTQSCEIRPVGCGDPHQTVLFSKPIQSAPTQPSSVP